MDRDTAREIDALARARNREDHDGRGCLAAILIGVACWVVMFALAARFFRWWHS